MKKVWPETQEEGETCGSNAHMHKIKLRVRVEYVLRYIRDMVVTGEVEATIYVRETGCQRWVERDILKRSEDRSRYVNRGRDY